jgi:hypothetical protein
MTMGMFKRFMTARNLRSELEHEAEVNSILRGKYERMWEENVRLRRELETALRENAALRSEQWGNR